MTISDSSGSSSSGGSKKKKKAVEMILDIHHVAVVDPEISSILRKTIQELEFTKPIQENLCMISPFGSSSSLFLSFPFLSLSFMIKIPDS
jgi:hypothetical protein